MEISAGIVAREIIAAVYRSECWRRVCSQRIHLNTTTTITLSQMFKASKQESGTMCFFFFDFSLGAPHRSSLN